MARRSSRKRRKQRRREAAKGARERRAEDLDAVGRGYARGRARDEAARAALEPLAEGERPPAVAVAGALAALLGTANLVAYFAGLEVQGKQPQVIGVLLYSVLMFVAAWGCFRVRYWAVLGMQVLLGLAVVIFSLLAVGAKSPFRLVIMLAVIGLAGALFWFLVKSMARIQMPERPGSR